MTHLVRAGLLIAVLAGSAAAAQAPSLVVAKFHADWCGSCRAMGDIATDLANKHDGQPVLFVTFDLTNATTRHQSELRAAALGLGELFDANKGKTGFLSVIDQTNKRELGRLTREQSLKDMSETLAKALAKG